MDWTRAIEPEARVERLVAWAQRIEFHELRFSSLDAAVSAVRRLARAV